jgi:uncharacterized protein YecT (DUF1311 family)
LQRHGEEGFDLTPTTLVVVLMLAAGQGPGSGQCPSRPDWRSVCAEVKALAPPDQDLPDAAARARLAKCDEEALYFGIGMSPRPDDARRCAFLQREADLAHPGGPAYPFSGAGLLTMVYANGVGGGREVKLALHDACELDGAEAEMEARIGQLHSLPAERTPAHPFSVCDAATSGFLGGMCSVHRERCCSAARQHRFDALSRPWSAPDRGADQELRAVADTSFERSSELEVDLSGSLRLAFEVHARQRLEEQLLANLERLERGEDLEVGGDRLAQRDAALNRLHARVLAATPEHGSQTAGTVTRAGVRSTERAWLVDRDAFVSFARQRDPRVPPEQLLATLTQHRIEILERLTP